VTGHGSIGTRARRRRAMFSRPPNLVPCSPLQALRAVRARNVASEVEEVQGDASRPQILDNLKRVEGRSGTGDRSFGAINTSPFASLANSGPGASN
jgi:hypothetical protein